MPSACLNLTIETARANAWKYREFQEKVHPEPIPKNEFYLYIRVDDLVGAIEKFSQSE